MSNITLEFNFRFEKYDGTTLMSTPDPRTKEKPEELWAYKVLANHLGSHNKGDAIKYNIWGMSIYNGKKAVVDKSDAKTIRDFIDTTELMSNLMKGQLLEVIDGALASHDAEKNRKVAEEIEKEDNKEIK